MYEYGNIEDAKPGDIVERIKKGLSNEPYHQIGYLAVVGNDFPESEGCRPSLSKEWWKLVKTLAGSEAKVGDTVIRFKDGTRNCPTGTVFTVLEIGHSSIYYASSLSAEMYECKVLCKAEPISTEKRNIAFYKRSGEPWTNDELKQIAAYTGIKYWGNINPNKKFVYDLGLEDTNESYANWADQNRDNFKNCEQVVYEDVFKTPYILETPRIAVVTVSVGGHPIGSRIIPVYKNTTNYWMLANNSSSKHYHHSLGGSCEWEDELVGSTWEQIDHSGVRNAGDITTISKISENVHIHYYDSNSSIYSYFFKMFKKYNPLEAAKPEPAAPCSQPTPTIPEEETMNTTTENITIAMTADEYAKYQKSNKPTKPKSQLETAPEWITIWYGVNGNVDCQTTESPKKAKKALQHPSKLGFTFRSYLIIDSATTNIPVVDIKI